MIAALVSLAALLLSVPPAAAQRASTIRFRGHRRVASVRVIDIPVAFNVVNVNRSMLPCQTDGQAYTIHGHVVGPERVLEERRRTATLYLHGATGGEWMFSDPRGSRFDTATQLARGGHTSVLIDMLGYGASGDPPGGMVCDGGLADITHQIIDQLHSGAYRLGGRRGVGFSRLALFGFSSGGTVAEIEAYSFGGIDALALLGWSDQDTGPALVHALPRVFQECPQGGDTKRDDGRGPRGYIYFWPTRSQEAADLLYDPDPTAERSLLRLIGRDPCGALESTGDAQVVDHLFAGVITVPVLLVQGDHDMVSGDPSIGMALQRYFLSGSVEVTTEVIPRAGHDVMAEKTAPIFQARLAVWLRGHRL